MAIAKKKPPKPTLPLDLADRAREALFYSVASKYHEDRYKTIKTDFFAEITTRDDITLTVGESMKFSDGLVRWQARANPIVDADMVLTAVQDGKLTVETLLALVSKWDAEAVEKLVPGSVSHQKPCEVCATLGQIAPECEKCEGSGMMSSATEFGVMQPTPAYREAITKELEAADAKLATLGIAAEQVAA